MRGFAAKLSMLYPEFDSSTVRSRRVPDRHEPDIGEVDFAYLFRVIDEIVAAGRWDGWIGCEYRPRRGAVASGTSDGVAWMRAGLFPA